MKSSNKKYKDSDADGLSDAQEERLGTDPLDSDTDKDGVGDFQEFHVYDTDPLDSDTDKDGMSDGDEIKKGRNPLGAGLLRNAFIPCENNNYRPHALRPRRLLAYGLSAIAIKFLIVIFIVVLPLTAWLSPDILYQQSQRIITLTNNIRTNLGINTLTENISLNQAAHNKATDMLINQYFAHVGLDGRKLTDWLNSVQYNYRFGGENLAIGFSSAEDIVQAWTKSTTHYANIIDTDFTEIGVGAVAGLYEERETTLVAQYFGTPKDQEIIPPEIKITPPTEIEDKLIAEIEEGEEGEVEADKIVEEIVTAEITIDEPQAKDEKIVRAVAYLEEDVISAQVNFEDHKIDLNQDEENKWTGSVIIDSEEEEEILTPLVPANIETMNQDGESKSFDIDWKNVQPLQTSLIDQYLFIKDNPAKFIQPLFNLSSLYYQILLIIVCFAFLLNIFIKIKKQNLGIIFSSIGFIGLLIILIMI